MGKIIKFDPNRRRKQTRSWTRPEDYGVSPPPRTPPLRRAWRKPDAFGPATSTPPARRIALLAKLAVALIVLAAVLVSLLGLD